MLVRTKCYWVSDGMNPWNKSREDCGNRGSALLMPWDQDELVKGMIALGMWNGPEAAPGGWWCRRGWRHPWKVEGVPRILGSGSTLRPSPPKCLWQSAEDTGGAQFRHEDRACFGVTKTALSFLLSRARNS